MLKLLVIAVILLVSVAAVGILLVSANGNAEVYLWRDAQILRHSDAPSSEAITVAAGGGPTTSDTATTGGGTSAASLVGGNWKQAFFCTFENSPTDCGFRVQEKERGRATIVAFGRDGGTALRLHTEPGDNKVAGSDTMHRNDVYLSQAATGCYEGREQVWELSVLFPDDFVFPTWQRYALSGFHHTGPTGQGNFTLGFTAGARTTDPGILGFQGFGGTQDSGRFGAPVGPVVKNIWYDFVYHIRWSSGSNGFFDAWVNGAKKLSHRGPTLYKGMGCYLKLANYHTPICDPYPACIGADPASSVIYDRVIRHDVAATQGGGRFRPLSGRGRSSQRESIARR